MTFRNVNRPLNRSGSARSEGRPAEKRKSPAGRFCHAALVHRLTHRVFDFVINPTLTDEKDTDPNEPILFVKGQAVASIPASRRMNKNARARRRQAKKRPAA